MSANPTILTVNCRTLTHAAVNNPPAEKYAVMTTPPITQPTQAGAPVTALMIDPIAQSCPARMNNDPIHRIAAASDRTLES